MTTHREKPELPVDRGWAWVIILGAFANVLIILSFNRSVSLLFIYFLDEFNESATVTTLAFAFCCVTFNISNLLIPAFLLDKFTVRSLATTGSVISAVCIISMAFCSSFTQIIILFGILGFSHGLVFVPQTSLIGYYFHRHLKFANAIANLGLGIATMISPVVTQVLLDIFGLQGTLLLHGGLALHMIPASLLFRPLSEYSCSLDNTTYDDITSIPHNDNESPSHEMEAMLPDDKTDGCEIVTKMTGDLVETQSDLDLRKLVHTRNQLSPLPDARKGKMLSASENHIHYKAELKQPVKMPSKLSLPVDHSSLGMLETLSVSGSIRFFSSADIPYVTSLKVPLYGSRMHGKLDLKNFRPPGALKNGDSPDGAAPQAEYSGVERLKETICSPVWGRPLGLMLLFGSGLAVHSLGGTTYLPVLGWENGLTTWQLPFLLTISGAGDLISKFLIGCTADSVRMKKIHIVYIVNVILGLTFQFTQYYKHIGLMIMMSIIFGMSAGVIHFMLPVLVMDTLGVQYIDHIMSGYLIISGVIMTLDHIVIGIVRDCTDSFVGGYNYMGALILLSVLFFSLQPLISYLSRKETKPTNTAIQSDLEKNTIEDD